MPKIFKQSDKIEHDLTIVQDKLLLIKQYKDIGLTLALRKLVNKDIYLLKTKLHKKLKEEIEKKGLTK